MHGDACFACRIATKTNTFKLRKHRKTQATRFQRQSKLKTFDFQRPTPAAGSLSSSGDIGAIRCPLEGRTHGTGVKKLCHVEWPQPAGKIAGLPSRIQSKSFLRRDL
jgi:hypothetical protein